MSLNKNLSKLALNVNANGDVTEAGLSATYTSNAYAGGTFATNTFVRDTFTSNNYVESQLGTKDTAIGLRATNTFVKDTFTSNNYSQDFFTNADNITSGTIASGRLSGTYSINISGSADSLDGKDSTEPEMLIEYVPDNLPEACLLYTSPSPRDGLLSRMPSSA